MRRFACQCFAVMTLATFALAALGGCSGSGRYNVKGTVKYNGVPLCKPFGQVVFVAPDGTQVPAAIEEENGTYLARQVVGGPNKVAVFFSNLKDTGVKRFPGKKGDKSVAPGPPIFTTPDKYASIETSNLAIDVGEGTVYDIELTGPKMK